uniref:Uncharacterized protein n=1 Tax=Onchocerca volvulus TaxID=6282 RepID=A0A8R1Y025_ONCVO
MHTRPRPCRWIHLRKQMNGLDDYLLWEDEIFGFG